MKRTLTVIIAISVFFLLATGFSCNDQIPVPVTNLRGYFWTTNKPGISHRLYIDNEYKGMLPHLSVTDAKKDKSLIREQGLTIPLQQGTHEVFVTDNNQTIISKGELKVKFTKGSTEIAASWNNGQCQVEIAYDDPK